MSVTRTLVIACAVVLASAVAVGAAVGDGVPRPRTVAEIAGMGPLPPPSVPATRPPAETERPRSIGTGDEVAETTTTTEATGPDRAARRRARRRSFTTTTSRPLTLEEALLGAALERIDYPWWRTGFAVQLGPARYGYLGETDPETETIQVFVRRNHTVDDVARTLAHEIGHAVDIAFRTPEERIRYRAVRGLSPSTVWAGCDGCSDYATPAGDFAEVFAWWLLGPGDYRSRLGPPPTDAEMAELQPLFSARPLGN